MRVILQSHSFAFQSEEQFFDKYAAIVLGDKYERYQELKITLLPLEIERYRKDKQKASELKSKKSGLDLKLQLNRATTEEFNELQEVNSALYAITFEEKAQEYANLEEKIRYPSDIASRVRSNYIKEYNPCGRKVLFVRGQYAPRMTEDLPNILRADGAIVKHRGYDKIEEDETFDDIVYSAAEICGGNDGRDTWPILRHAKNNEGFTLFFLNQQPLYAHCQNDPELKEARELRKSGKKIIIITDNGKFY